MNLFESFILGVIQGITEFLPISSSGHLVLGQEFLGLQTELFKNFDVAVHIGSLFAILVYFRREIFGMLYAFWKFITFRLDRSDPYWKLIIYIFVATVPVAVFGFFGEDWIDSQFRSSAGVATAMIVTGFVFIAAEFAYKHIHNFAPIVDRFKFSASVRFEKIMDVFKPGGYEPKELRGVNLSVAFFVGIFQVAALIPGVSRSGATIVGGLFRGIERSVAAKFSFLLAMPAIFGAGLLTVLNDSGKIFNFSYPSSVPLESLALGFFTSFIFSFLSIGFLMHFFRKFSLNVFAVYLIVLGVWTFF
jgi:undecaprenyl-diphosphatase